MDVLVEFCRTGELVPLRRDMTLAEVERLLGQPNKIKWLHGEQHMQRHRYGSLSLTISCRDAEPPDEMRLRSMRLSFDRLPLELPEPIANGLAHPWTSSRLEDVLASLHAAGVETTLEYETLDSGGGLYREFSVGRKPVTITAFDGGVTAIFG